MKKIFSLILSAAMIFNFAVCTHAEEGSKKVLQFGEDGKFKIMQINDTQDTHNLRERTQELIRKAIEEEKPDLVVVAGDILSDAFLCANDETIPQALRCLGDIFEETKTPFAVTFGNHDHDLEDKVSIKEMADVYLEYEYCVNGTDGCDPGTYNIPILSSDGSKYALNVYMMDTNNKNKETGGYQGVYPYQVQWYKDKSDELKAQNGGQVVPSVVFQHIPVKEIYQLLEQADKTEANTAVYRADDGKWYKLNEDAIIDIGKGLGEAPCPEDLDVTTGQYEAWLEKGDVMGAFFGHDHVNNFVGKTQDGIILGYNGGTGFKTYGLGNTRSVRCYEFDESDVTDFTTYTRTYGDLNGEGDKSYVTDIFSTVLLTWIMRFIYKLLFIIPW